MATREQMVAAFGSEEAYRAHMAAIGRIGGKRQVPKGTAKLPPSQLREMGRSGGTLMIRGRRQKEGGEQ
jgi:general stress protein YciG